MKAIHVLGFLITALFIGLCSGAGGFFVGNRLGSYKADELLQGQTVRVLVAAQDLPAGTLINDPATQLRKVSFLPESVPPKPFSDPEDLRGKVIGRTLLKNAPVTAQDLSVVESLFRTTPPGTRAVTIRVHHEEVAGSLLRPGSRVDIVARFPQNDDPEKAVTKLILEDVMILVANVLNAEPPQGSVTLSGSIITVAVAPENVERLIEAKARGQVTVVLRRPGD